MAARIIAFDSLESTNDYLTLNVAALPDGAWVRTTRQTAGRGRHGRRWTGGPGNLFASTLAKPQDGEGPPYQLSFVAALALLDAALPYAGRCRLSLKWPNDLLLGGAKCAGILLERTGDATVIGFGVNLMHAPAGLDRRVACLAQGGFPPPDPADFCEELADAFARARTVWRKQGFPAIRSRWLARATPVGHRTQVQVGQTALSGRFAGVADDGALLLQRDDGISTIYAGDVWES